MNKIILLLIIIIILIYFIVNYSNYSFQHDNGEIYGRAIYSPDKTQYAQMYSKAYGGAAGGVNVYITIVNKDKKENIYYSDAKENLNVNWLDNNTISITNSSNDENRNIALIIGKEIYDDSGKACKLYAKIKKYTCYSER